MKKWAEFLKEYAPVAVSLGLSGALAFGAVQVRNGLWKSEKAVLLPKTPGAETVADRKTVFSPPADGERLTEFSDSAPVFNATLGIYEVHEGEDYACGDGQVYAAADGRVKKISYSDRYGLTLTVLHEDGSETEYASLSKTLAREGQRVKRGEAIARAGETACVEESLGAHVHFAYRSEEGYAPCPFASETDS